MNYYQAREILKDGEPSGKWHYTVWNDNRIMPVGYCAQGCEGHETREGAYEHQTAYLLDHQTRYDGEWAGTQYQCMVCKTWTSKFASVDHQKFTLCDEHRNREQVAKLFGTVADAISSC